MSRCLRTLGQGGPWNDYAGFDQERELARSWQEVVSKVKEKWALMQATRAGSHTHRHTHTDTHTL